MNSLSIYPSLFEWKIGLEVVITTFSLKYFHLQALDDAEYISNSSVLEQAQTVYLHLLKPCNCFDIIFIHVYLDLC